MTQTKEESFVIVFEEEKLTDLYIGEKQDRFAIGFLTARLTTWLLQTVNKVQGLKFSPPVEWSE